jgi:PIN domain nuclease of toxin-antitoxin system
LPAPIILDTCAVIWKAEEARLLPAAEEAIAAAYLAKAGIFISPITAWEVGLLMSRGRLISAMAPGAWLERVMGFPGIRLAALSADTLIASSFLPGDPPKDPADRIIAATAREHGYTLVTRDRPLLAYAEKGHVQALAC